MSTAREDFDAAVERVKQLPKQGPDVLLTLYGLYKQATEGDVTGSRPGMLDVRGRAKYDAWAKRRGTPKEQAQVAYTNYVEMQLTRHGLA